MRRKKLWNWLDPIQILPLVAASWISSFLNLISEIKRFEISPQFEEELSQEFVYFFHGKRTWNWKLKVSTEKKWVLWKSPKLNDRTWLIYTIMNIEWVAKRFGWSKQKPILLECFTKTFPYTKNRNSRTADQIVDSLIWWRFVYLFLVAMISHVRFFLTNCGYLSYSNGCCWLRTNFLFIFFIKSIRQTLLRRESWRWLLSTRYFYMEEVGKKSLFFRRQNRLGE